MNKYINSGLKKDVLKHALLGSILSAVSAPCISIFYIIMGDMFLKYDISNDLHDFSIKLIIVEFILSIFFIILYKISKVNKFKQIFFIISLIIFINLLSIIVFIAPDKIFYNMGFETGLAYTVLFVLICNYIIFLLSYLIYIYISDKSVYFNKQLCSKNNLIYFMLYVFYCVMTLILIILFFLNHIMNEYWSNL